MLYVHKLVAVRGLYLQRACSLYHWFPMATNVVVVVVVVVVGVVVIRFAIY